MESSVELHPDLLIWRKGRVGGGGLVKNVHTLVLNICLCVKYPPRADNGEYDTLNGLI